MNENILWNTVTIRVPSEFISVDKNGKIKISPPITKSGAIAKKNKKPSINIVKDNTINKVEIVEGGEYKEKEARTRTKKQPSEKEKKTRTKKQPSEEEHSKEKAMIQSWVGDLYNPKDATPKESKVSEYEKNQRERFKQELKKLQDRDEANETKLMAGEDVNRGETMHQKMERLRQMRKGNRRAVRQAKEIEGMGNEDINRAAKKTMKDRLLERAEYRKKHNIPSSRKVSSAMKVV
jgi:hypothetical protein